MAPDRRADLVGREPEDSGERTDLAQAHAAPLRQVGRPDLDGAAGDIRHEHFPVAIQDRATRSLHADVPALIVLRRAQELLAVQDLQRPQTKKERCEDREREHAEDPHSQGELRREPVRLCDVRIGRQEAPREAALSQGGAPLVSPIHGGAAVGA